MLANKLNYGDTIGVVGVSNSLKFLNRYDDFFRAEELLKNKGFKIKRAKNVLEDYYGSAGTREQKAEEFMNMFKDDEVKAIVCLTGGETCNTFIELLDEEEIKKHPKIVVGYSDITVLLHAIYKKTGLVTFSGPNFVCFGTEYGEEQYKIFEEAFVNKNLDKFNFGHKVIIRDGKTEGKIIGTNLGCMVYLLGTEYLAEMQDTILFIESYRTSPNECQRRFAHLKQLGIFDKVKGIVVGYNYDLQKNGNLYPQMEDILKEYTKDYTFPIIKCNDFGHEIVNSIIPIGGTVKINSNEVKIIGEFLNSTKSS
jgi:muramoyltetrapeptide carboxypeptidase